MLLFVFFYMFRISKDVPFTVCWVFKDGADLRKPLGLHLSQIDSLAGHLGRCCPSVVRLLAAAAHRWPLGGRAEPQPQAARPR